MKSDSTVLQVRSLKKSFAGRPVLYDVGFSVSRGECVAVVGENGAGKSTLFRPLFSLLRPDSGEIRIGGTTVSASLPCREKIGLFMGGDSVLYGRLTARENIRYFARLNGVSGKETMKRIDEYAGMFGMHEYLDRTCAGFSHGMRQKSALVRSIIHDPPLIILDEPMTGLDISTIKAVKRFITHALGNGKTIIYATHALQEVLSVCSRMLLLHRGRLLWDTHLDRIDTSDLLEEKIDIYITEADLRGGS